ncbi:hypothetical protein DOTSEDRAFT_69563 [Dothistroma septosporum NZE10]|uniref:Uncharacterized protein n=1 Tax=Dothistroma septosporum (strain NZE10 / CBS 128990) TaxID=675120 RepID=N1PW94_DOTSN|nr:hypothetical protein DOTSEDRAFT_69563 [Dothistroma septosporum NZE10]
MEDRSSIDWDSISFSNGGVQLDDLYTNQSAFDQFTNMDAYAASNSPMPLNSKPGPDTADSSQDSSSDTSSRRKRKTESESPISDPITEIGNRDGQIKQETDMKIHLADISQVRSFDPPFQPMNQLSLGHGDSSMFNSAASSPVQRTDYDAMSLDAHVNMPRADVAAQFENSPVQTINPGMFTIGGSRDQSPATNNLMFNQASPNALFSTPSSDSQDFANNPSWNPPLAQNPNWPGDFNNSLTSPGAIAYTPCPGANGTPAASMFGIGARPGRSPLNIAPISTKSRVETQINVVMTLEKPPPGIENLHLPLHTIAKSKLLAKDEYDRSKVLELHTMLVCSSAMHNAQFKEKALQRAASALNEEIQQRAELARESTDDEKNDPKNVEEADKPANGGEVRICSNCIQRERKRAGRKKTKREEEQQHWERYETERVVVFNSNEYLPFKPYEGGQQPLRDGIDGEQYIPPEGSLQVTAAMRIACYCRHQSEKEGFQVIFTMKDQQGNVVAQQMSDSILITDDHKTHPPSFSSAVAGDGFYQNAAFLPNGLPMSHSMVDMTQHIQPFTSSRSAGNLQALAYTAGYNPHSHVHQLPGSGYNSQTTSATMTPTSLSRPGSPTSAGQVGPNKKRKSSTFHRKVPSGLTMTPRVDTSQSPSSNMPSAMSMGSQFSPSHQGLPNQMNQSYMTIPNNNGPAQYYNSGPPTPNESGPFNFSQPQVDLSQMPANQAYFSHPSSAVPSRSSSPVMNSRGNMAAYARQQPIQTPTNSINARPQSIFANQARAGAGGDQASPGPAPMVQRTIPSEGSVAGGNEVAILGEGFAPGMQVAFGDQIAQTSFLSSTGLSAIAPANRPGSVFVTVVPPHGQPRYLEQSSNPVYKYTQSNEDVMVMALKQLSEQHFGQSDGWQAFAQQNAASYMQQRVGRADTGFQQQGYTAQHRGNAIDDKAEDSKRIDVLIATRQHSMCAAWHDTTRPRSLREGSPPFARRAQPRGPHTGAQGFCSSSGPSAFAIKQAVRHVSARSSASPEKSAPAPAPRTDLTAHHSPGPDCAGDEREIKRRGSFAARTKVVAGKKSALISERLSGMTSSAPSKTESGEPTSWLWMPLFTRTALIVLHAAMQHVSQQKRTQTTTNRLSQDLTA